MTPKAEKRQHTGHVCRVLMLIDTKGERKVFESIREAEAKVGIGRGVIYRALSKNGHSRHGQWFDMGLGRTGHVKCSQEVRLA